MPTLNQANPESAVIMLRVPETVAVEEVEILIEEVAAEDAKE